MFCHLKVLLKLLNVLTRLLAVNEFNYDRKRNRMVSSRFWHCYVKVVHRIIIWPLSLIMFGYLSADRATKELSLQLILVRLGVYIIATRYATNGLIGWYVIHYRLELCRLLNQFLRLAAMHREIFGRDVDVSWLWLAIHLMRETYLVWQFTPLFGCPGVMLFITGRLLFQFFVLDVSLMIHYNMIKSLAEHIDRADELSHIRPLKRSRCIEYFEQLLQLKQKLQQFTWISNTGRLSVEISMVIMFSVEAFWLHFLSGNISHLAMYVSECVITSNMLPNVRMARSIEATERKVFDQMYEHEMLAALRNTKTTRRSRLEQVIAFMGI